MIYMAGQSRGGCLAFRLGSRFRKHSSYKNVPLILQSYDAQCNVDQNELYTSPSKLWNPLYGSSYSQSQKKEKDQHYAWKADLNAAFPNKCKLSVQNPAGGGVATDLAKKARAFTMSASSGSSSWFKTRWVALKHQEFGGDYGKLHLTVTPGYSDLLSAKADIESQTCSGSSSGGSSGNVGNCPLPKVKRNGLVYNNRPVCKSVVSTKIKRSKCTGQGGFSWLNYCLWNKGSWYDSRKLK